MNIHNGKLFFDSTQVTVRETLEQFAHGKSIDQIADTLQGKLSKEFVEEAQNTYFHYKGLQRFLSFSTL